MAGRLLEASAVVFLLFASFAALSAFGKAPAPAQYHAPAEIYPQGSGSGLDADTLDAKHAAQSGANILPYTDASGKLNPSVIGATGVSGSGSANYVAKWASGTSLGNSIIYDNGNVGVGTASPGQKLSVAGTIESTSGGIKFPDGSVQTTAAGDLYGGFHSSSQCTLLGGTVVTVGSDKICRFNSASCQGPFVQYNLYTTTSSNACDCGCGAYGRACTTGSHIFSNTNAIETCIYCTDSLNCQPYDRTCSATRTQIGCY